MRCGCPTHRLAFFNASPQKRRPIVRRRQLLSLFLAWFCWFGTVHAETIVLRVPEVPDSNHAFFHELLREAFGAAGQPIDIKGIIGPGKERFKMMLRNGELDVMWLVRGPARDRLFVPVDFPLTGGLIGQRVLMIRPGDQSRFDQVKNLDDFQRLGLRAGMGKDWVDIDIWKQNGLPVTEAAPDWRRLFKMLGAGNRDIDYVPRGALEIIGDTRTNPGLAIEQHLLLRYERDSIFYLTPAAAHLAPTLKLGLERLRANGTYERLLEKYHGQLLRELNLPRRLVLDLRDIDETIN